MSLLLRLDFWPCPKCDVGLGSDGRLTVGLREIVAENVTFQLTIHPSDADGFQARLQISRRGQMIRQISGRETGVLGKALGISKPTGKEMLEFMKTVFDPNMENTFIWKMEGG